MNCDLKLPFLAARLLLFNFLFLIIFLILFFLLPFFSQTRYTSLIAASLVVFCSFMSVFSFSLSLLFLAGKKKTIHNSIMLLLYNDDVPVKTPELHYSMIQFLNITVVWEHQYGYHENALNDFCSFTLIV